MTRWFREFIERHGLAEEWKGVHVHSLRHSNASLMIATNKQLPVIAKRLGHANASITARVYAHAFLSVDEQTADDIEVAIHPKKVVKEQGVEQKNHAQ